MTLEARSLRAGYDRKDIIANLDFSPSLGKFTVMSGSNGSGKSTLLSALSRMLMPSSGVVMLDGASIHRMPSREVAKKMGFLPQGLSELQDISVLELVSCGRYPHKRFLSSWLDEDEKAVAESLEMVNAVDLSEMSMSQLSGGQRQRCWIAMLLAQGASTMLLDEPTTFLDLRYQIEIVSLLRKLCQEYGRTIVAVLHDLNMASQYADELVFLKEGSIFASGDISRVFTPSTIESVFGWPVRVFNDELTGRPYFLPFYDES